MDIIAAAAEIDRLYAEHDAAEGTLFEARRVCEQTTVRVQANLTALTHATPSTLEETLVTVVNLAGHILGSHIENEGEARNEIDRLINSLLRGVTLQLGDRIRELPKWVRAAARIDEEGDPDPLKVAAE